METFPDQAQRRRHLKKFVKATWLATLQTGQSYELETHKQYKSYAATMRSSTGCI